MENLSPEQFKEIMENVTKMSIATGKIANVPSLSKETPRSSINYVLIACGAATAIYGCCYLLNRLFGWCERKYMGYHGTNQALFENEESGRVELLPGSQLQRFAAVAGGFQQMNQEYQESEMSTQGKIDQPSTSEDPEKMSPEEKREMVKKFLEIENDTEKEEIEWLERRFEKIGLM